MTVTLPTTYYANFGNGSTTGYYAVAQWATGHAYTVGNIVRQLATPAVGSERCFVCGVAGTSGGTEPTWSGALRSKTTDNTVSWYECTGTPVLNNDFTNQPLSSQNRSGLQNAGSIIVDNTQTHAFICTTAGTTGSGEPTYNTTTGGTTTDGTATWTCLGASFTNWGAPIPRLANANGWISGGTNAPGGVLYVSSAHAETQASALSIGLGGAASNGSVTVICVNNSTIPPTSGTITTGATVSSTGNSAVTLSSCVEFNGINFTCGSGANAPNFNIGSNAGASFVRLRNCAINLGTSSLSAFIFLGTTELINTTVGFGSANTQRFYLEGANVIWRDTPSALSATTWPTSMFGGPGTTAVGSLLCEGVDFSAFAGSNFINGQAGQGRFVLSHCKLPSASLIPPSGGVISSNCNTIVDLINCDNGGATYDTQRYGFECVQSMSTNVVATGGASDGTTSYSWLLDSGAGSICWTNPFEAMPISIWNSNINNNVTVTLQGAYVGTALPFNDQVWMDVMYFGTSSSTLSTRVTTTKATILAAHTQWSSSSTLWGGSAAARQNSHAYSVGDAIGVSSAGSIVRAFVCTASSGNSAASLPGGYATAVDGSQVTDGSCTFTAVERFAMTTTLSSPQPAEAGYIAVYVKFAVQNGLCYIDPNPLLS